MSLSGGSAGSWRLRVPLLAGGQWGQTAEAPAGSCEGTGTSPPHISHGTGPPGQRAFPLTWMSASGGGGGRVLGDLENWPWSLPSRRCVCRAHGARRGSPLGPLSPPPPRPPPAEMPDGPADTCFSATEALNCVRAPPAGRPGARQVLPALPFVTRRWLSGGQCPCPPRRAAPRETTPAGRSSVKGSTTDKRTRFLTSTWACSESLQHFLELSRKVLEESGVFRGTVGSLMLMMPMIILAPRSSLPRPLTCSEASTSGGRAVSRTRRGQRQDRRLVRAPADQGASRPSPRAAPWEGGMPGVSFPGKEPCDIAPQARRPALLLGTIPPVTHVGGPRASPAVPSRPPGRSGQGIVCL